MSARKSETEETGFVTKAELVAHMKGAMFPTGKRFAPSLVMWGDPHAQDHDIDALEHLSGPEEHPEGHGS